MPESVMDDVRVLELGEGVSAAFCAKLFADYGVYVVKVKIGEWTASSKVVLIR